MARRFSFFNRPVALATKAEGNKAKEIKKYIFRGKLWFYNISYYTVDATNWFNINEGDMPPCERVPCQNNGVCIPREDNVHDYRCNCTKGYTGTNCETHSACESENCNGGECIAKDSNPKEFICLCPLGRVGVQCETGGLSLLIKYSAY